MWEKYWVCLALNLEVYFDMLIYLLNTIALTPGGSNTVHIYTQTMHRTTQLNWKECEQCPVLAIYSLELALQLTKNHGKTSVREGKECQLAR